MTCSDEGMYNCAGIKEDIKVGDGNFVKATKMGEKCVLIHQPGGVFKEYVIHECKYVPKLCINLVGIPSALRRGWNLSNIGIIMSIRKNNHSFVFDQVLPTSSGAITGVIMQPNVIPHAHVGVDVPNQKGAPTHQAPVEAPPNEAIVAGFVVDLLQIEKGTLKITNRSHAVIRLV
jgi:hypothetical protein